MSDKFNTLLTGFTGVTLVEMVDAMPTAEQITSIGQVCIQIAIGLVTLYRLLNNKQNNNKNTPTE